MGAAKLAAVKPVSRPPVQKNGNNLPESGKKSPPRPTPQDIQKAVQQIQTYLSDSQRQLQFRVDEGSGRTVMTVINPLTKETIRQIPAEEVLALAAAMRSEGFHVISDTA